MQKERRKAPDQDADELAPIPLDAGAEWYLDFNGTKWLPPILAIYKVVEPVPRTSPCSITSISTHTSLHTYGCLFFLRPRVYRKPRTSKIQKASVKGPRGNVIRLTLHVDRLHACHVFLNMGTRIHENTNLLSTRIQGVSQPLETSLE